MASRLSLHEKLCNLLDSRFVYFQPPESIKLNYPCIVYNLDTIDIKHGDNINYTFTKAYSVTIIDKNPDSEYVNKIINEFSLIRFDRSFVSNNLNHFVYRIYY